MEIFIRDIGLIHEAAIKLDGLTVITGKNDSGKSTVGKTLYSLVNALNHYSDKIQNDAMKYITNQIENFVRELEMSKKNNHEMLLEVFYELFYDAYEDMDYSVDEYTTEQYFFALKEDMEYNEFISNMDSLLNHLETISVEDDLTKLIHNSLKDSYYHIKSALFLHEIKRRKIETEFREIFHQQVFNFYSKQNGKIEVPEWDQLKIEFEKNKVQSIAGGEKETYNQFNDVTYIESPLAFNRLKKIFLLPPVSASYEENLIRKLLQPWKKKSTNMFEETLRSYELEMLDKKLTEVLVGDLKQNDSDWGELVYTLDGEELKIQNLATGLKTFMIIRRLLDNGYLEKGSLLIIDEPEVHLHPEWQLKFAELIVILMKTLKVTVLLATHSPYFLNAIEVFSKKYECTGETHYYLAERKPEGAVFRNIDDNLNDTYDLLAEPFQTLEDILYE